MKLASLSPSLQLHASIAGNIRNLAMEKVASQVLFPCKYCNTGCNINLLHTDKEEHEEACEYRYSFSYSIYLLFNHIYYMYIINRLNIIIRYVTCILLCIKNILIFYVLRKL